MPNVDEIVNMREGMQFNTLQDDILFVQLANSELAQELTGEVRKRTKMTDNAPATREDCYITSLSLPAGSVQLGTSHVNIIVPDKTDCTLAGVAQTFSANTGRPFELHIFPKGPHGSSLCTTETWSQNPAFVMPNCAEWSKLAVTWIRSFA